MRFRRAADTATWRANATPTLSAPGVASARRPDRLAFYMGCCPHRRKGCVSCGARRPYTVEEAKLDRYACSSSRTGVRRRWARHSSVVLCERLTLGVVAPACRQKQRCALDRSTRSLSRPVENAPLRAGRKFTACLDLFGDAGPATAGPGSGPEGLRVLFRGPAAGFALNLGRVEAFCGLRRGR